MQANRYARNCPQCVKLGDSFSNLILFIMNTLLILLSSGVSSFMTVRTSLVCCTTNGGRRTDA